MQFATSSKLTLLKKLHHETYEKKYPQVSHFWKMPLSNQAISSLTNGLSLPHISFCTLKKNEWLDDNVMNYALHMISLRNESIFVLDSFLCTSILNGTQKKTKRVLSKVNLQAKKFIMGAYNKNGYHWNLLFLDVHTGELMLIDPQGHREEETSAACKSMKEFFNAQESALSFINWKPCCVSHSFQKDSSSCGIFVLQIAKSLISGLPVIEKTVTFENTLANMEKLRWQWAHEILSTSRKNVKMHFPTTANPREKFSSLREEEKSPGFDTNNLQLSSAAVQSIELDTFALQSLSSNSISWSEQNMRNYLWNEFIKSSTSPLMLYEEYMLNTRKSHTGNEETKPQRQNLPLGGNVKMHFPTTANPREEFSSLREEEEKSPGFDTNNLQLSSAAAISNPQSIAELSVDAQQVEDALPTPVYIDRVERSYNRRQEQAFIEQNQPNNDQSSIDILEVNQKPLKRKQENIFKSPEGNVGPNQKKMLFKRARTTPAQTRETNYPNGTRSLAYNNNNRPIAPKTPNTSGTERVERVLQLPFLVATQSGRLVCSISFYDASTSQPQPTDKAKEKNKRDQMNESSRKSRAKKKAEREERKNKIDRLEGENKQLKEKTEQLKESNNELKQTSLPALVSEEALNQVPDQGGYNVGDCETFGPVQSKSSGTNLPSHDDSGIHRSELSKGFSKTRSAEKSRQHRAKVREQDAVDKDNLRRLFAEKQRLTDELNRLKAEHVLLTKK